MHRRGDPNSFVLNLGDFPGQAANSPSPKEPREQGEVEPITHTFQINMGYFRCEEHRYFFPKFNYEVVKVQATGRDSYHILNFPVDQLSPHITERAIQLSNVRMITFNNPLYWDVLIINYQRITEMALYVLNHVQPSLTMITFCADILNDALFFVLSSHSHLREVEILLDTVSFDFQDRLVGIEEVLNRGVAQLPQVEHFRIPRQLVTNELRSRLGGAFLSLS